MGDSSIEWTEKTWNPTTGCTEVSAGCDNCYARTLAHGRLSEVYGRRLPVVQTPENIANTFSVRIWPERLSDPASWRKPSLVFVNSMSDLFHVDVPEDFLRQVFGVMLAIGRHTYQVLTKRPARALRFFERNRDLFPDGVIPAHIWLGTSVENQDVAYRIDHLIRVPAAVRFLSCEPLIGPLELGLVGTLLKTITGTGYAHLSDYLQWVIVGGESGLTRRPVDPAWVRALRDECVQNGVPFFFKQWGGRTPKAGGRMLDGRVWDEYPEAVRA